MVKKSKAVDDIIKEYESHPSILKIKESLQVDAFFNSMIYRLK